MRTGLLIILIFTIGFSGVLWYQDTAYMCPVPITYRIGVVDERFGISRDELRTLAEEAEGAWEVLSGTPLFVYDDQSNFPINLIFDERQQQARTQEEWGARLDAMEVDNTARVEAVTKQRAQYLALEQQYEETRIGYESRLSSYNNEVAQYNEAGGAPNEEYERLQAEAATLTTLLEELGALEGELRRSAEALNRESEAVNAAIEAYNTEVLHYNELFGESETFTQGDYRRDRINVYKFTSPDELKAVLVHEFGHALGIGHVEEESAVMYHLMTERVSSTLQSADREAFLMVCGDIDTFAAKVRKIIRTVVS
jgi:hypothetical protein